MLKLVVKKIALISCYFQANCLLVSSYVLDFIFLYFANHLNGFLIVIWQAAEELWMEKYYFFNKIYNSWRHNKSEPLQEPGLVGQFGPNPSSMIKLEVKHEITIRIIRELVIKEQFRYLTSPLPPPAALSTTEDTPSFIAVIRFRNNHQPRLNKINPMFNFPIDSI